MHFGLNQLVGSQGHVLVEMESFSSLNGTKCLVSGQSVLEDGKENDDSKRTKEDEYGVLG